MYLKKVLHKSKIDKKNLIICLQKQRSKIPGLEKTPPWRWVKNCKKSDIGYRNKDFPLLYILYPSKVRRWAGWTFLILQNSNLKFENLFVYSSTNVVQNKRNTGNWKLPGFQINWQTFFEHFELFQYVFVKLYNFRDLKLYNFQMP